MTRLLTIVVLVLALAVTSLTGGFARASDWIDAHRTPQLRTPPGWPQPVYDIAQNPVTTAGFELGRRLFYDPQLSRDGTIACASCHQQFAAFAHYDHRVSHGLGGANGKRNAPGLFNLAWQPQFMWDGGVTQLDAQPLAPLTNPVEMGETIDHVLDKLRRDPRYPQQFARAFGDGPIDTQRFTRALAQFMVTMTSADSRYDRYLAGREHFSEAEQRGLAAFRAHCSGCHTEPLLTDHRYRSNGLDEEPADAGRALITGKPDDRGLFHVPSLRNVALTAPYMHDGRFETLEQVLDHYAHGLSPAAQNDPLLRGAAAINAGESADILAFLDTLSDERFIHDSRFAENAAR